MRLPALLPIRRTRPAAVPLTSRALLALLALLAILALPALGCSVSQRVSLEPDGSGTAVVRIRLDKLLVDYLQDLAEVSGAAPKEKGRIFDVEEIRKGFASRQEVTLRRISSPSPERLEMELEFRSIEKLFAAPEKPQTILSLRPGAEGATLRVHLDRGNFAQLLELAPFLKNPIFEGLGPQENDDATEAEYLELIDLALGEGGAAALKASMIETTVLVKGQLTAQSGGAPVPGGVVFRIPLLRVLRLDKPLDYSLSFK
jgi:hypothetical protein